jgi:uncharacterized protein YbjT (DUF2867 family)
MSRWHPLEEDPGPSPVRVDDRARAVEVLLGHPLLAEEDLPRVVPGGRRLHDVPERLGPERGKGGRVGAVEDDLDLERHQLANQPAASFAWYVRIRSAPARRIDVSASSTTLRSSSQPFSAAAFSIAYSPLTL